MASSAITSHDSKCGLVYSQLGPDHRDFALILVHGWSCQASDYSPLMHELSTYQLNYPTIAVDLPGHGRSPSSLAPEPSISTFASALLSLIHELRYRSVVLAGHSMSMRVVLEAFHQDLRAPRTPDLVVRGLIFVDGSHYRFRPSQFPFDRQTQEPSKPSGTAAAAAEASRDPETERAAMKAAAFQQMFSARTPVAFQTAALAHVNAQDPGYADAIRRSHLAYDREALDGVAEELGRTAGRTALLNLQSTDVDARNQRVPLQAGQRSRMMQWLQETVPTATQKVVVDAGHFPHVDQPKVVAKAIVEFIQTLENRGETKIE